MGQQGRLKRRPSRDSAASGAATALFSVSLGMSMLALPLLALRTGYSATEIGVLTALSAVSQLATRLVLGAVMRRWSDWTLIAAAAAVLAVSNGLVVLSAALAPFLVTQLLQGAARACFWTGSQTHAVRGSGRAVGPLAVLNLVGSAGLLAGPLLAGHLSGDSPTDALLVASVLATLAALPALLLDRLPPFVPPADRPPGRLWRRPGVGAGCWAGTTAGAWRALLGSYVPVALDGARQSSVMIGALVSVANAASLVGAAIVGRLPERADRWVLALATLAAGVGTGLTAVTAGDARVVAVVLTLGGLGAGALQTLGPALAAQAVHREERGDVIALTGTFRAAALFAAPLAVAAMVAVVPLGLAMAVAGAVMTLPGALVRHRGPLGTGP